MKSLGYDMLNINDPFYQDICIPYKSENNTDILLSDRIDYIYNNQDSQCQNNCQFSSYLPNSLYINCTCSVAEDEEKNEEKFSGKKLYESFYDILKYSNFKILKCYKLIFNKNIFKNNMGNIIILIIFLIYFVCFIFYIIRGITPFKNKLKDIPLKAKNKNDNKDNIFTHNINFENKNNKDNIYKNKILSHPLKRKIYKNLYSNKNNDNTQRKKQKPNKINFFHKSIKPYIINNSFKNNFSLSSKNELKVDSEKKEKKEEIQIQIQESIKPEKEEKKEFDSFELNQLEYDEAIFYDKRTFIQTIWDILSREHKIIFTFFICNDYNLLYIKYSRFIFLFATDMALNVFFFSDESMHKIFLNYGKYNFIQQIPQIVYTTIISQLIEVFLCYLSLTDKHIYNIKNLSKSSEKNLFQKGGNKNPKQMQLKKVILRKF